MHFLFDLKERELRRVLCAKTRVPVRCSTLLRHLFRMKMRIFSLVFGYLGILPCVFLLGEVRDEDIVDIAFGMIAGIRSLHEQRVRAPVSVD